MESTWNPLFTGRAADPYNAVIDTIVESIDRFVITDMDWGKALLHAYLAEARSSEAHRARAVALVDRAAQAMATTLCGTALHGGLTGVAWLSAHTLTLWGQHSSDEFDEIDDVLIRASLATGGPRHYDLIGGTVGIAVYFLERLPHLKASKALQQIAVSLGSTARRFNDHAFWHTAPQLLPEWQRNAAPDGYFNLGVAHGVPGIVGALGEMRRYGLSSDQDDDLLRRAMRWVLAQASPEGQIPSWIVPGVDSGKSRVAWCYGELGVSIVLLLAARALGDSALEASALDLALRAAKRRDGTGVVDAGLCHGAAGNAHLFNRLYQATARGEFQDAAAFWFNRALEMRVDGMGVAGYRAYQPMAASGQSRENPWTDDPSFLMGATGIALAFLAATTSLEPAWDRVLLSRL
jgi:lantibiotic modifying enzyme